MHDEKRLKLCMDDESGVEIINIIVTLDLACYLTIFPTLLIILVNFIMNQAKELKDTLNLPQTAFPMRANAVRARKITALERYCSLYEMVQKNKNGDSFVLHDVPPFTNGDVHVGTALNKILKDTILRYKSAGVYRTPYIPGWDCHGLPIEHKVTKELRKKKADLDPVQIRKRHALSFLLPS